MTYKKANLKIGVNSGNVAQTNPNTLGRQNQNSPETTR